MAEVQAEIDMDEAEAEVQIQPLPPSLPAEVSPHADAEASPPVGASYPAQSRPRRRVTRACDQCKNRKVKCDNLEPACSSCRLTALDCSYTIPERRRGPPQGTRRPRKKDQLQAPARSPDESSASLHSAGSPWSVVSRIEVTSVPSVPPTPTERLPSVHVPLQTWTRRTLSPPPQDVVFQQILAESSGAREYKEPPLSDVTVSIAEILLVNLGIAGNVTGFRELVNDHIAMYSKYIYPITPLVNVNTLKEDANRIYWHLHGKVAQASRPSVVQNRPVRQGDLIGVLKPSRLDTAFILMTALCANVALVVPQKTPGNTNRIGRAFFRASRNALSVFGPSDFGRPQVTSIVIWYLHCGCHHHRAKGDSESPWLHLGFASTLTWLFRSHDEKSYAGLTPEEAELRRRCFWQLVSGNISAGHLNGWPMSFRQTSLQEEITAEYPREDVDIFAAEEPVQSIVNGERPEPKSVITGFNYCQRLWRAADDVIHAIDLFRQLHKQTRFTPHPIDWARIEEVYIAYLTVLDSTPPWLQLSMSAEHAIDLDNTNQVQLAIQRANLRITYHFLHMVIQERLADMDSDAPIDAKRVLGGSTLKKTEIARDLLEVIRNTPREILKANGESCVEKIRRIGVVLLEIINNQPESPLVSRAQADLTVLLDILASLDSKACDSLTN